jgi:hypothetical protein
LLLPVYLGQAALVWLLILRPPHVHATVELDASWKQLIGFDYREAVQAGVDFLFTYGPLGYFLAAHPTYLPDLYWQRVRADMVLKALLVIAILLPAVRMPRVWQQLVYLTVVVLVAPLADDAFPLLAITAVTLSLLLHRSGLRSVLPTVVFFAVLGMGKFTYFMLGGGCVALLCVSVWRRSSWRHAFVVPTTFVAAFTLIWIAIGQSVANLPAFVKGSLQIASGYNESMRWVATDGARYWFGDVLVALSAIGLALLATLFVCLRRPWQLGRWLAACAVAAALFMGWKSGFVRQDAGHSMICFCCAAIVPLWAWTFVDRARQSLLLNGLVLAASVVAFVGAFRLEGTVGYRPDNLLRLLRSEAIAHFDYVVGLQAAQDRLEQATRQVAADNRLPAVRAMVGDAPIDEVPHGQSILFLNDLHLRHRPVFQSYSAYTAYLQQLNGDFYEDPRRGPAFVLFQVNAIDRQFPTVADSQIYRVLLHGYRPSLLEREHLLLERSAGAAGMRVSGQPGQRQILQQTARFGEWVPLEPGAGLGELAIDLDFSLRGKLWNFAFRGPRLYLDVRLANGQELTDYVVSRGAMQLPFVVDPLIQDTRSFAKLYLGARNLPRVVAFRLRPRAGRDDLYVPGFRCTFWRSELPVPLDEARARALRIEYPMFDRAPRSVEPEASFSLAREGDKQVQVAEAPSVMTFDGLPGTLAVAGTFGIRRDAYEGDGGTDGVTFRIERVAADGQTDALFERRLEPKQNAGDRGMQHFAFEAQVDGGAVLVFRTLAGADSRWDWSYWTDLKFNDLSAPAAGARRLMADRVEIVRAEGGTQVLTLDAGAEFAHRNYRIAGTSAGTEPGSTLLGVQVPLNASPYLDLTQGAQDPAVFDGFRGRLDADGRGRAALHVPQTGLPGIDGSLLHHAFAVLDDDGRILMVSNPVALRLR